MEQELIDIYAAYFSKLKKQFNKHYPNVDIKYDANFDDLKQSKQLNFNELKELEFYMTLNFKDKMLYSKVLEADFYEHAKQYRTLSNALNCAGFYNLAIYITAYDKIIKLDKKLDYLKQQNGYDFAEAKMYINYDLGKTLDAYYQSKKYFEKQIMQQLHNESKFEKCEPYPAPEIVEDIEYEAKHLMNCARQLDNIEKLEGGFFYNYQTQAKLLLNAFKPEPEIKDLCEHEHCDCEHGIIKSAIKHTINITIYILIITFVLNLIIYFIGEERLSHILNSTPVIGPIIAALVGLIPNCASSVIITQLYVSDVLNFATMISGLLVNTGVGLLVLFRTNDDLKENIKITVLLFAIGAIFGIFFDLIGFMI